MNTNHDRFKQREETYDRRVTTLLTLIGLWLALPATCSLLQRIVDTLTSLNAFSKNASIVAKLVADSCLLGIYIVGLLLLIGVGFMGWLATKTKDVISDTVDEHLPRVKAEIEEHAPCVKAEWKKAVARGTPHAQILLSKVQKRILLLLGVQKHSQTTSPTQKPDEGSTS
jgi:hypothetical protein